MPEETKYAFITSATSGLRFELAKLFAKDPYNLIIGAGSEEQLQKESVELSQQSGIKVIKMSTELFN